MGDPERGAGSPADSPAGTPRGTVPSSSAPVPVVVTSIAGPAVRAPASSAACVTTSAAPHARPKALAPFSVSAVSPATSTGPAKSPVMSPVSPVSPASAAVSPPGRSTAPPARIAVSTSSGAPHRPSVSTPTSGAPSSASALRTAGVTSPAGENASRGGVTITVRSETERPAPRPKPPRRLVKQMSMAAMVTGVSRAGGGGGPGACTPAGETRGVLRRSSFSEDYFPSGPAVDVPPVALCTPLGPGVVLKKTLDGSQGQRTRRCSLTQPWATLYGSWQQTQPVSAASSRNGSTEGIRRKSSTCRGARDAPDNGGDPTTTTTTTGLLSRHKPVLFARHLQKVTRKDFGSEVRASLDVSLFIKEAQLLLDVGEMSVEAVVDQMLVAMLEGEPMTSLDEAKSVVFVHDSVTQLAKTIQGTCASPDGDILDYDQTWVVAMCTLPTLQRRHMAVARLKHPANFGRTAKQVKLFVLVLVPSKEKGTKNALETARTFATIIADMDVRQRLLEAHTAQEFMQLVVKQTQMMATEGIVLNVPNDDTEPQEGEKFCSFGRGLRDDLQRRTACYIQDFVDGFVGNKTLQKTISTTFFLYFACILPAIAFGILNDHNTNGKIDVKKVIIGQTLGGLFFYLFGGQPLMVLLTTAPLAIYIKIIHTICEDFELDFFSMYCAVGLWNSFFIILYSVFGVSRLMRWSTRSTEEIFAIFISIAFAVDASRDALVDFQKNYWSENCTVDLHGMNLTEVVNSTFLASLDCHRENSLLFLLLMLGTLWVGVSLYNFNKTPYLEASKRELLADYSLPIAVLVMSFVGSFLFADVNLAPFRYNDDNALGLVRVESMGVGAVFGAALLGFCLSLLFFMDQNITSAMVNNPGNKLKKGPAYHLDLMVVALLNGLLSLLGLPWMHAAIPHSPLHVRSMADVEERVEQGHVYEIIVKVRETRVTGILSHALIGLSVFLLPYPMSYIPPPVLNGLFLYMAITALNGNQMFERITLFFMEQVAYPPNHYIRRVPQRKIHIFTGCQVLQLGILCVFGFSPWSYMKTIFPVLLLLLLPIRHRLIPMLIEEKYLTAMDMEH